MGVIDIEAIEGYSPELLGILPKDSYHNLSKEDNNKILNRLLRNFNDRPTDMENDVFGEIYKYFLDNFALKKDKVEEISLHQIVAMVTEF